MEAFMGKKVLAHTDVRKHTRGLNKEAFAVCMRDFGVWNETTADVVVGVMMMMMVIIMNSEIH